MMVQKYDSGVNIMGSIPDYNVMLDYISDFYGVTNESIGAFVFRSEKSFKRFIGAIDSGSYATFVIVVC